jgi:hypothetical protein
LVLLQVDGVRTLAQFVFQEKRWSPDAILRYELHKRVLWEKGKQMDAKVCISSKSIEDANLMKAAIEKVCPDAKLHTYECSYIFQKKLFICFVIFMFDHTLPGKLREEKNRFCGADRVIVCVPSAERILIDSHDDPDDYKTALRLAEKHTKDQARKQKRFKSRKESG